MKTLTANEGGKVIELTMKTTTIIAQALLLAATLALASGCTTTRKPDYRAQLPSATAQVVQQAGVEIALDPFVERERTQPYFGIHAVNDGIAILYVRISNHTPDQTFLVAKKHFELLLAGASAGQTAREDNIDRSTAAGEAVLLTGVGIGSVPMLLAGGALISQSTEIRRNFVSKEMPDQTLPPGQSVEGFIYYTPVTRKLDWSRGAAVKVSLPETRTRQVIELNVHLSD